MNAGAVAGPPTEVTDAVDTFGVQWTESGSRRRFDR
jgi:hypothetical protein